MKNLKTHSAIAAGLMIMMFLLLAPISGSKGQSSGIERLIAITHLKAQTASDEAFQGADKQRSLVKKEELLRSPGRESTKRIAGPDTSDNRQLPGRLTSREIVREKAMLQLLEANARKSAEILESLRTLAAELNKFDCKARD